MKPAAHEALAAMKVADVPSAIVDQVRSRLLPDPEDTNPWQVLAECATSSESNSKVEDTQQLQLVVAQHVRNILLTGNTKKLDDMSWNERIAWCNTPEDFHALFAVLQVPGDEWKNTNWYNLEAKKPTSDGGIGMPLGELSRSIARRFGSWPTFVAWMEGKNEAPLPLTEEVRRWDSPKDAHVLFERLNIPDDKWRSPTWLNQDSKKTPEEGGIGSSMRSLYKAIVARFGTFKKFFVWMEGVDAQEKPWIERSWVDIVQKWESPEDAFDLFKKLQIPDNKWRKSSWLCVTSAKPTTEGGIGMKLAGLHTALRDRFASQDEFLSWMEPNRKREISWVDKVAACKSPEQMKALFEKIGILDDAWRSGTWMAEKAKLPKEEGGIGKNLAGLYTAICKRFRGWPLFIAWIDDTEVQQSFIAIVNSWKRPEDALAYFSALGVPAGKWKSSLWLESKAKLGPEEGGIHKNLAGLSGAIRDRFNGSKIFAAWMDGAPLIEKVIDEKHAREILKSESDRLGIAIDELLTENPTAQKRLFKRSPALKKVFAFFHHHET